MSAFFLGSGVLVTLLALARFIYRTGLYFATEVRVRRMLRKVNERLERELDKLDEERLK